MKVAYVSVSYKYDMTGCASLLALSVDDGSLRGAERAPDTGPDALLMSA